MTPETEVIACPACKHLVRVPLDWLGTQVQCPECKALFRAPVRGTDGKLTEPELLSRPASASTAAPAARKPDLMLMLPAFGLLLCGVMGLFVNAGFLYQFYATPGCAKAWADGQIPALRKLGVGADIPPEQRVQRDDADAAQLARFYPWVVGISLPVSAVVFLGGLSIVFRRNYRLAQIACALAAVNVHGCCILGAAAGLWGLLMLGSDEGREHFLT
jgi:hypothetical protein